MRSTSWQDIPPHHPARLIGLDPIAWADLSSMPERALLAAIVMEAYRDVTLPARDEAARAIQQEAWEFLATPGQLDWFCTFLDIDPARLRAAVLSTRGQDR